MAALRTEHEVEMYGPDGIRTGQIAHLNDMVRLHSERAERAEAELVKVRDHNERLCEYVNAAAGEESAILPVSVLSTLIPRFQHEAKMAEQERLVAVMQVAREKVIVDLKAELAKAREITDEKVDWLADMLVVCTPDLAIARVTLDKARAAEDIREIARTALAAALGQETDGPSPSARVSDSHQTSAAHDALAYLADPGNWLGDPLDQTSTLHGHFTPFEMARMALGQEARDDG